MLASLIAAEVAYSIAGTPDQTERPHALPAEVVKAWEGVGAEVGWYATNASGRPQFYRDDGGGTEKVAAFRFAKWKAGAMIGLAQPQQAFVLDFTGTHMTDAGLKELIALENLESLDLSGTDCATILL